ncbi:hypothetical protein ACFRFH_05155 [Leifsonia sp. NPDC056824]|uniref:hypothetical protein n=1 Tax=Leifsonia sp. NPDC056824 TaxID=3345953 RepID=UPI0036AC5405
MTIPEDENTPQPPDGGNTAGAVPPVPEPTEPAAAPTEPAAPAAPASDVPPVPPMAPPAAPAGAYPPAPPAPQAGAVPPPPGAFPSYAAVPPAPVAAPTRIPTTVNTAFWLYIASAVLSVIGGIVTITSASSNRAAFIRTLQTQNLHGQNIDTLATAAIGVAIGLSVVTLIFWAIVFVLFAFFMRRGANWARIVLTVLTVLSLANILPGFPFGLIQVIASIVAVILIWLRPSSAWFAAIKASKAPRA